MKHHHTWTITTNSLECLLGRGIYLCCQNKINVVVFVCDDCYLTTYFVYLIRRNTSVDESYEWDSADACVDSEVLEAMRFDQSQMRRGRSEFRHDQAGGLQDQRQKGNHFFTTLLFPVMFLMLHVSL